ncbi:MAG: signal peptidase I [Candidatus Omnitrophota bacterium]|nr:signal peptidase I [Candidatus Omnitrophota bacterium]
MTDVMMYGRKSFSIIREVITREESAMKLYARGNSMGPLIKEGDIVVIRPSTFKEIRIGDIAVFGVKGKLCAHRLIMKRAKGDRYIFVTKSDKTFMADAPFGHKNLFGRVSRIQKGTLTLNLESFFWTFLNRIMGLYHLILCQAAIHLGLLYAVFKEGDT